MKKEHKLELSVKKDKDPKKPLSLIIKNKETNLTEKIIEKNIQFPNMKFKILIEQLTTLDHLVRSNYLQEYYPNTSAREVVMDYTPNDIQITLDQLLNEYIYKISAKLVEIIPNTTLENDMLTSNSIIVCNYCGLLTQKKVNKMYKEKFQPRSFYSLSEKDNIKAVTNEIRLKNLEGVVNEQDIKALTYEGRTYENIKQFIESKNKTTKLMDERRKKKFLFSLESEEFFERKSRVNQEKNVFMKNEWFMGPIYSYDYNYKKFI